MIGQTAAEHELATVIVAALNLEGFDPRLINPQEPLFRDGLGLDSVDALEIAFAVFGHYGVQLRSNQPDIQDILSCLRSLSEHIERERLVLLAHRGT